LQDEVISFRADSIYNISLLKSLFEYPENITAVCKQRNQNF